MERVRRIARSQQQWLVEYKKNVVSNRKSLGIAVMRHQYQWYKGKYNSRLGRNSTPIMILRLMSIPHYMRRSTFPIISWHPKTRQLTAELYAYSTKYPDARKIADGSSGYWKSVHDAGN